MTEMEKTLQKIESIKVCSHCGANIKEDVQFCTYCGRPTNIMPTKKFCVRCGTELNEEEMFCHNCGSPTSQSRDVQVMNNIAAYNSSIIKPKKQALPLKIKNNSVFPLISWILTAIFVAFLSAGLTVRISYATSFKSLASSETLLVVLSLFGFAVTTITGILFWNNDKKLRIIPVIASLVATVSCAIFFESMLPGPDIIVAALLMHIVAILFAVRVIKTKAWLYGLSIIALVGTLSLPVAIGSNSPIPFLLSIPMFLLTFSFTTKETKETPKKKRVLIQLVVVVLAIFFIVGGVGLGLYHSWVYVGDITNTNVDLAKDKYSRLVVQTKYEYSETVEKGLVIKQSIEKDSFIHPDTTIILTVSKGEGVKIPQIANLSLDDAKKKLEALGLKVSFAFEYSSSVAKNRVIRASSYHVDEGSTVTLTISKGPDNRVRVPDVTSLTESKARKKLQDSGFKVKVEYVYRLCDADSNSSKVTSQSLSGKQNPGSTVTINVTKPSISITRIGLDHNYVGGVDVSISFKNTSNKKIKYVTFAARFKNSVGDNVYCDIRHSSTRNLEYTGPLNPGKSDTEYWDAVIYNWACSRLYFDSIEVTFMDGTKHIMTYNAYWYM